MTAVIQPSRAADVLRKQDLDAFEQRMMLKFDSLDRRLEGFGTRAPADSFAGRIAEQIAEEIRDQTDWIVGQTRQLIMVNVLTAVLAFVLLFGIAKLA